MWSVISDPNGGYVQGINQGNAQGTMQLQDTNMTMQNINTMQGIAQSSVQGLVQQPQQPQIVDNLQGTTQGLMGNAQAQPQIANVQGMTQGTMGNAQGIIFQQNGHSQGIGQPLLPNMTYIQGNPQYAGAGAGMGDQQLFQQIKQMSVSNPMMFIALQEFEKRMLTNMTPIQNMAGVSPGYNCQGLGYNSNVQTQGIQVQPQGMQLVQPQGMSKFQQLGQNQVQVQQMVQPQVQQMLQPAVQPLMQQTLVQQPVQQPIMQQLVQQQFVQQGAIQPSMPQLAVQQPVKQPAVQPVVQQQPLQQHVVHQPMQPAVQQPMVQQAVQQAVQLPVPVQPLVVQQPVTQQPVPQPVQQHAVQQFVQQPAIQQPALQQVVQQPIVQQPVQPQMVPQPAVHQPPVQLTQPGVQQHVQLTPVTNQVMPSQNQILTQNQYQGILQVCNQGIPQTDQSQGLQPSENQGLQLGSQNASMQPVQGYLGMTLQVLKKGNHQPPQSQQEDPGVQQELTEVNSSLCQPTADHSNIQMDDECNQTNKLCGQHGTEVGSQPDDQGQISQHDNTHLMQVIDSHTLQKSWPESDSEMLLMTEVPEQTWLPLLPSLPPQNNEDQSPPPQDSDYQFIKGEVSRDNENITYLVPPTINKVESSNGVTEWLGGQYKGIPVQEDIKTSGSQLVHDRQKSSQNHDTNGQVIINPFIPAVNKDVVPCTKNHQKLSDQMPVTRFCQKLVSADQNEDEMHDFSTAPSSSTISTYSDMYRAMSIMHDTCTYPALLTLKRRDGCYEHLSGDMYEQHPIFTYIRQRRGYLYTSDDQSTQEWQWYNSILQNCAQLRPGVHQICLTTETKYKPPDRYSSDIVITAVGRRQSLQGQQPVSLVDETKYKPPGTVQEDDKWHWCDGVPWSLTHDSHSNQGGSPCNQYLEVETKFRPPDATHQM